MHHRLDTSQIGIMLLFLLLMFSFTELHHSFAKEPDSTVYVVGYQLAIKDKKINLRAKDISLKIILEDIGQKMGIEVVARIPEDEKVTIQFNDQTMEETLKLFKLNYAIVTDSQDKGGSIKRIVVVPEGQQAQITMTTSGRSDNQRKSGLNKDLRSKNESFKFEFEPSKVIEKE